MSARLRHFVSKLVPENQKYRIAMLGSHVTYSFAKLLKGMSPLWQDDAEFKEIYGKVQERILLDHARCYVLLQIARRQKTVPGDIVEIGAYRCGASLFLTANDNTPNKTLHIIDTFAGLPHVGDEDPFWKKGEMGNTDFSEIKRFLAKNLVRTPYKIHQGYFPQEVPLDELKKPWSLVHIDTDLYQPTLDGLRFFYPLLSPGGIIVIDDFGNSSCPGVVTAVREYEKEAGVQSIFLISGHAVIFKH